MRRRGYWGISYQLSVVSLLRYQESGLETPPTKRNPSHKRYTHSVISNPPNPLIRGESVIIPFLKVYIALTAPERTDSQSMLQGGTN